MEKLTQDLKKGYLNLFEAIRGSRNSQGNENGEEDKSESVEGGTVQEEGIKVTARGPKLPDVPKDSTKPFLMKARIHLKLGEDFMREPDVFSREAGAVVPVPEIKAGEAENGKIVLQPS
ncbi:hypothetical protein POTOM_028446 [Populus tomentosa]|uniref:Uncharacterized protein n=1 Tax=Populus tomentosa TaxID=118781 RepID=A0A8X7ZDD9_POPTO|nr:hypothetical protein POTOM_028446 [Populus tomentosa]